MNHIGTHDTARALTMLGKSSEYIGDREWQSQQTLTGEEYEKGIRLLKAAAVLQYTLPGVPSLYYGDEAGMQGYGDPFCRAAYPWGKENEDLLEFYKKLGEVRRNNKAFISGEFLPVYANFGDIVYIRRNENNKVLVAVNRWHEPSKIEVPEEFSTAKTVFGAQFDGINLNLKGEDFEILIIE